MPAAGRRESPPTAASSQGAEPQPTVADIIGQDLQRAIAAAQVAQRQAVDAAGALRAADALAVDAEAVAIQAARARAWQDEEAALLLLLS